MTIPYTTLKTEKGHTLLQHVGDKGIVFSSNQCLTHNIVVLNVGKLQLEFVAQCPVVNFQVHNGMRLHKHTSLCKEQSTE